MGAKIDGAGTSVVQIEGVKRLSDAEHTVIPDRIVAATYLSCGAAAGGTLELTNVVPSHMEAVLSVAEQYGAKLYISEDRIVQVAPKRLAPVKMIRTQPHPGLSDGCAVALDGRADAGAGARVFL